LPLHAALPFFTNGAIYALMALGIVVLYSVTNVINVAQGEYVMLSALTVASLRAGAVPGTVYIVMAGLLLWGLFDAVGHARRRAFGRAAVAFVLPLLVAGAVYLIVVLASRAGLPYLLQIVLAIGLTTLLGPITYRVVVQPLPRAAVVVYLILAIGLHLALTGLGWAFSGPQPYVTPPFQRGGVAIGAAYVDAQGICVLASAALLLLALWWFLGRTLPGKALRAASVNRLGACLSGVSVVRAGSVAFALSVFLSAVAGVLIT